MYIFHHANKLGYNYSHLATSFGFQEKSATHAQDISNKLEALFDITSIDEESFEKKRKSALKNAGMTPYKEQLNHLVDLIVNEPGNEFNSHRDKIKKIMMPLWAWNKKTAKQTISFQQMKQITGAILSSDGLKEIDLSKCSEDFKILVSVINKNYLLSRHNSELNRLYKRFFYGCLNEKLLPHARALTSQHVQKPQLLNLLNELSPDHILTDQSEINDIKDTIFEYLCKELLSQTPKPNGSQLKDILALCEQAEYDSAGCSLMATIMSTTLPNQLPI